VLDNFGAVTTILPHDELSIAISGDSGKPIIIPIDCKFVIQYPIFTIPMSTPRTTADEGLSYVVGKERFTLRDAIAESGPCIIGKSMRDKYGKWQVYSKFGPEVNPDASAIVAYKN